MHSRSQKSHREANLLQVSNNLDMLRTVAVSYVVADHSLKLLGYTTLFGVDIAWFGHLGVMLFFVHTCMVLMMSLERSCKENPSTLSWSGKFYLRRIFRIYPLSIVVILLTVLFKIPLARIEGAFSIVGVIATKGDVLSNLLLVQTLTHRPSIIGPLWSLPFELQMYALLPFVFLFLARRKQLVALLAIWAGGVALEYVLRPHAFFLPHFISGVVAYVLLKRGAKPFAPSWAWPALIGAITICFLALWPSFLTGALACLILGTTLPRFKQIKSAAVNAVTHNVAKYSYGVYLSHMFCLWFAFIHLRFLSRPSQSLVFALLLIGIPMILYHAIEEPGIRYGSKLADRMMFKRPHERQDTAHARGAEALEETASGL